MAKGLGIHPPPVRVESPCGRGPIRAAQQAMASPPAAAARASAGGGGGTSSSTQALVGGRQQQHTQNSPQLPAAATATAATTHDPALAAASIVRPKVLFPPIGRPSNPDDPTSGTGAGCSGSGAPHGVPGGAYPWAESPGGAAARGSPPHSPQLRPRTVGGLRAVGAGGLGRSKSSKSQATSMWASPGSPIAPPDSREQFLIWLDSTFAGDAAAGGGSGGAAGYQAEAMKRRQRRMLFEEQWGLGCGGEGLGTGGIESRGLQRLLCRPLHHLWQDSPEAFSRQGGVLGCQGYRIGTLWLTSQRDKTRQHPLVCGHLPHRYPIRTNT